MKIPARVISEFTPGEEFSLRGGKWRHTRPVHLLEMTGQTLAAPAIP